MTINGSTVSGTWVVNILMLILITIIGFSATREYDRNDDQEQRLRAVEQVCVEVRIMSRNIIDMQGDLKTLLRK